MKLLIVSLMVISNKLFIDRELHLVIIVMLLLKFKEFKIFQHFKFAFQILLGHYIREFGEHRLESLVLLLGNVGKFTYFSCFDS